MKSFLNIILDGLTFKDIAGKRQPRAYTILTGFILLLILLLASCVALERNAMMEEVRGTPEVVQITLEPALTEAPVTTAPETCPTNPTSWTFVDVLPGDNFKRIADPCVYDGLAKSVAWAMAVRSGYTRQAATLALGFDQAPIRLENEVMTLTNGQGPLAVPVTFTPPHPDFAEWRMDETGGPAVAYGLRGCFRTVNVVGNQARSWNDKYPVLCVLSEDSTSSQVTVALDGHVYTSSAEPMRAFALFGYTGNGKWTWLGTRQEPKIPLTALKSYENEAQAVAKQYGVERWDGVWLSEKMGLAIPRLPDNWQDARDETELQLILDTLNQYLLEVQK
jgi:hypothetical protein